MIIKNCKEGKALEEHGETMKRVGDIIQRLRKKNLEKKKKQNGIKETWKDSSEVDALENCPICGGKGYIIKHSPDAQDTIAFCKCREMDKLKRMWSFSGIETQKNKLTFKNYNAYNTATEEAKNIAIKYFKSFKQ